MPLTNSRKTHEQVRAAPIKYPRNEVSSPLNILRSTRNVHNIKKTLDIKQIPDINIKARKNQLRFIFIYSLMKWKRIQRYNIRFIPTSIKRKTYTLRSTSIVKSSADRLSCEKSS